MHDLGCSSMNKLVINMRKPILFIALLVTISAYGQDLIARKAPVDRNMKVTDSTILQKSAEDVKRAEVPQEIEIPIIVDNKEEWEWLQNEDHAFHDDSYPIKMLYYTFKSHPQYKVICDPNDYANGSVNTFAVYKNNGVLVRVGMITDHSNFDGVYVIEEVRNELLRQAYIKDYRNNKYNFKKESTKAQNFVKKELGLISDYVTLKNIFQTYSETAMRYLEQLEKDHSSDFYNLLKCERINNLSFKVTFGNKGGEATNTFKVAYTGKGTYKYGITVSELPLEQIDWSQVKTQNASEDENRTTERLQRVSARGGHFYKVKTGETIQSVARKLHYRVEDLCKLNNIGKNARLRPGQILKYNNGGPSYSLSSSDAKTLEDDMSKETDMDFSLADTLSSRNEAVDTTRIYNVYEIDEAPSFPESAEEKGGVNKDKIYDVVEEMPQFPGGPSALFDYLSKSIQYPAVAEENRVQGRVICTFVVEPDGAISDVKVVKSVDPSLDKEAVRVLSSMPKWIPGKQYGSPVRVKYTTPVSFRLQ